MNWFKKIKTFYERGFWTVEMVRNAVLKGKITETEFEEITGEKFLSDDTGRKKEVL